MEKYSISKSRGDGIYVSTLRGFILFLLILASFPCFLNSQTIITIGNDTNTNDYYNYPAPYGNWYFGAKHQFLIRASELTAEGMIAGNISSLAFDVATIVGTPLTAFTIKMKLTTANVLVSTFDQAGFITVYGPKTFIDTAGWNTHNFSSPFYWDGTSNILIETCFDNNSYTANASVYYTLSSFVSTLLYFADSSNVCSKTHAQYYSTARPNIRFNYAPPAIAPSANFNTNTTYTCLRQVSFYDLSTFNPTSWLWNFGDGSTSTLQNPTHTYSTNGTYTISMIASNAYGSDTLTFLNYINIISSGSSPIAASCNPNTLNGGFGFGITHFSFNTINNTSGDASNGYSDFTCLQTNVYAAQTYAISALTNAPSQHNVRAWIDYNNDGIFNTTTELVFSADNVLTSSGNITIPASAVINVPLRLRISADYNLSPIPTPCSNLDYGQAEDYTIRILPNIFPPVADFIVSDTLTCNGSISFTDHSTKIPTSWYWTFGDGGFSNLQHPTHIYSSDGTYTVTLIATNAYGSDTVAYPNLVTVNLAGQLSPIGCSPITLAYCCGYGIYRVVFNNLDNPSGNGSESYRDFSCSNVAIVTEGHSYPISIKTGTSNPQDTKVWIDYDNNSSFSTNELVFQGLNAVDPSGNITIPAGLVLNIPLRMRVSSDFVGNNLNSCTSPNYGQVEDYAVIIQSSTLAVPEPIKNETISVYPNPVSEILTINITSITSASIITISDILGKSIYNKSIPLQSSFSETIDVSKVTKGMYFLNFISKGKQITRKLLIQ